MINIPSTIKISLRALRVNKMRSALTIIGIVIGVGAVITMLAVGSGARQKISSQIASMGSNLLIILPGSTSAGGVRMGAGTQPTLTAMDTAAIIRDCPSVQTAAPVHNGVGQVMYGGQNWSTGVIGTTPDMLEVREWPIVEGRAFTPEDVRNASKVCVLGQTVIENLFFNEDPLGKSIRIKNIPFTVIGILDRKGQNAAGQDQDDTIYIPVTTAQKKLFGTSFPGMIRIIMVKAKSAPALDSAEREIIELLRQRHRTGKTREDDFTVRNLTEIMQAAEQATVIMSILLGSIASVSLLVGGIGIMNIMLVSVTERTREIGIRMAVGANTWDIRLQFIIEALTLSLFGGLAGITFGVACATIVSKIAGWPTIVSALSVILSFCFSAAIGIIFGYYPAYKASLLDPIDALRYE